jgi:adenine-specific DNA-methyltransferase
MCYCGGKPRLEPINDKVALMHAHKAVRRKRHGLDCFDLPKLRHVTKLSYGERATGNALIQGENLKVLDALMPRFEGAVRCCYIDPPYNNREKHYHYHDSRDHRTWLDETTARVEALAEFLRDDGSLWVSIDDREVHYLKVACDAILGRKNFVTTIVWQQRTSRENRKVFSNNHEYLLVYAKDIKRFNATRNGLAISPEVRSRYKNPDNDPRGPWQSITANAQAGHGTAAQFYKLVSPSGKVHFPPPGRCWIYGLKRMRREMEEGNLYFGRDGEGVPRIKRFLSEVRTGLTPETLWTAKDVGTNDVAKKHLLQMFPKDVFDTPKPETLIHRVLEIATSPGDLVLDAYLGSGTTAAVAHKCDRAYIGIEQGDHAVTHCAKRLSLVVDGDPEGVSSAVSWAGGGGFDFFRLDE